MELRCPGQRRVGNSPESEIIPCPSCKREVEFFSDEQRVHCRCGEWVFRETVPSCAKWCAAAERCLGKTREKLQALRKNDSTPEHEKEKKLLKRLQNRIADAQKNHASSETRRKKNK